MFLQGQKKTGKTCQDHRFVCRVFPCSPEAGLQCFAGLLMVPAKYSLRWQTLADRCRTSVHAVRRIHRRAQSIQFSERAAQSTPGQKIIQCYCRPSCFHLLNQKNVCSVCCFYYTLQNTDCNSKFRKTFGMSENHINPLPDTASLLSNTVPEGVYMLCPLGHWLSRY